MAILLHSSEILSTKQFSLLALCTNQCNHLNQIGKLRPEHQTWPAASFANEVSLGRSQACPLPSCLGLLWHDDSRAEEPWHAVWLTKPKPVTNWPFKEESCWSWFKLQAGFPLIFWIWKYFLNIWRRGRGERRKRRGENNHQPNIQKLTSVNTLKASYITSFSEFFRITKMK